MMILKPKVVSTDDGDLKDLYFDLTLIISNNNELLVIDNSVQDWKDYVDCNTLLVKHHKLRI
tara:strand:- start:4174 stop:4359 length:186 start_codon:yes stop_codon:yes gene_type:complete